MTTILQGLKDPVRGERVLAVSPPIAPELAGTWLRRPNFHPGRSVSPQSLDAQHAEVGGRLALFGQSLAPGVVSGLEVSIEQVAATWFVEVAPGVGLMSTGEDVRLTRPLRIALDDIVVWQSSGDRSLGQLRAAAGGAPLAVILLLEAVVVERTGEPGSRDPCELDVDDLAFEDARELDAVRLVATPYPFALPPVTPRFRNALVSRLFEAEAALGSGGSLAWEASGLALALLGFSAASGAPFIDASAVAREGGYANRRRTLLASPGTRRLWQARFRQFIDELAELDFQALRTAGLGSRFRFLPPVGVLPAGALDVRGDIGEPHVPLPPSPLFPPRFVIEAAPIELESIDDLLQAAAGLAPLDLDGAEQVQVLVPLPQLYFDPQVLLVEDETPDEFRAAIRLFLLRLNHRLGRRYEVRDDERKLREAIFGSSETGHPPVDPDAVLGEVTDPALGYPEDDELPAGEAPPREPELGADTEERLRVLVVRMAQLAGAMPLGVLHDRLLLENGGPPLVLGSATPDSVAIRFIQYHFASLGLSGFVQQLSMKLLAASEGLDMAFLRVRSELYRVQARIAGESAATQLATSPALAAVAPRPSGASTPIQLEAFKRFILKLDKPTETLPQAGSTGGSDIPSEGTSGADGVPAALVFGNNVLQRLASSLVVDAKESAARAKRLAYRKLLEIHRSGLSLTGLLFPGFRVPRAVLDTAPTPWDPATPPAPTDLSYRNVRIEWVAFMLEEDFDRNGVWRHDPTVEQSNGPGDDTNPQDEAGFFAAAIRSIEQSIAGIRLAEGRLAGFERALGLARERLTSDLGTWKLVQRRLAELDEQISEYRHDVRVARSLEREEIERARRTNAERRQLIEEHVPFLVFRRPRAVDALLPVPTIGLAPARTPDPVPVALRGNFEAPEALRLSVDLLRDAPLDWLSFGPPLLSAVNRRNALLQIVEVAHFRASRPAPRVYDPLAGAAFQDETGEKIREIFRGQLDAIASYRSARLRFAQSHYYQFSWAGLLPELARLATLNDVALGQHGRQDVARRAQEQLENIYRVAAYAYDRLRQTPPFARLAWVEVLSQASSSVDLRDLSVLPEWSSLEAIDRRELQTLADWLYQQVQASDAAALRFMHDLLATCILLATHPPTNQILLAEVQSRRAVAPGASFELNVDARQARVGMHVLLYESPSAAAPVGRGVLVDLGDGIVTVRLASTDGQRSIVPVRAEIVEPDRSPDVVLATGESVRSGPVLES